MYKNVFFFSGVQHAGKALAEMVKKLRNPLMNPAFALSKGLEMMMRNSKNPSLKLSLGAHLHPSLKVFFFHSL